MHGIFKFAILMLLLALPGCRTMAIENVESALLTGPDDLTLAQVKEGIVTAGLRRDWHMQEVKPGHLVAEVTVRGKHRAVVDIFFDTKTFSILYKDSENLHYDGVNIHKNYVHWVRKLRREIQTEIGALRVSWSPPLPSSEPVQIA